MELPLVESVVLFIVRISIVTRIFNRSTFKISTVLVTFVERTTTLRYCSSFVLDRDSNASMINHDDLYRWETGTLIINLHVNVRTNLHKETTLFKLLSGGRSSHKRAIGLLPSQGNTLASQKTRRTVAPAFNKLLQRSRRWNVSSSVEGTRGRRRK